MRQKLQEFMEKFEDKFNKLQKNFEEVFKSKFEKLTAFKDSLQEKEKSSYTYEHHYTNFGKEREDLIVLHKKILEKEQHDSKNLRLIIQNMFNDYDEIIRKYRGILPLDYSTHIIPDKAHAEEGREIETEILQFFPIKQPKKRHCTTRNRNHQTRPGDLLSRYADMGQSNPA